MTKSRHLGDISFAVICTAVAYLYYFSVLWAPPQAKLFLSLNTQLPAPATAGFFIANLILKHVYVVSLLLVGILIWSFFRISKKEAPAPRKIAGIIIGGIVIIGIALAHFSILSAHDDLGTALLKK